MPPERKSKTLIRRLISGLILGFVVLIGLVLIGDLRQVSERVFTFRWTLYPAVIMLTLFNYVLRFVKWHFYIGQIGVRELSIIESTRLFVAGFPLAVTPGKVGEALKGLWLNRMTNIAAARGVSVVLAERISDGMGVLALSTLGVIAYPRYWPVFAIVLASMLGVIIISQIRPLALALLDFSSRLVLIKRFTNSLREFYEGSFALFRPKTTLIAVGLGTISWLAEGIGLYVILLGLDVSPSWDTLSIAVFVLSFSTVVGAISALPGGLGAADASIAGMLTLLLGLGTDISAAATLLIRFATLWFGVGLGLVAWIFSKDLLGIDNQVTNSHLSNPE